ncbi:MAG TPA: N-acetylmuramoyl-L-alanine amidase, partial [Verrucomicrobiota bacterium]|nr:N-acetylmuramoyl-L-alanine amidase [Verrucomicrobiota bacterium]
MSRAQKRRGLLLDLDFWRLGFQGGWLALGLVLAGCRTARIEEPLPSLPPPTPVAAPAIAQCPVVPEPPAETNRITLAPTNEWLLPMWVPWEDWCLTNGLKDLKRVSNGNGTSVELTTPRTRLILSPGNRLAAWNGVGINLGYSPCVQRGQLCVHTVDLHKSLLPLVAELSPVLPEQPVIVIDPGHGGKDPGCFSVLSGRPEKDFTLDWARRIQRRLAAQGLQVHLTRTNDIDLSLPQRAEIAHQLNADLFISLHFNSVYPTYEPAGIETYCLTPKGMPSSLTRDFEDDLTQSYPNNAFDPANLHYAVLLHRSLLNTTGARDRTVKRARFLSVLRPQQRPAILLEGGFLSNPTEARRIADPNYRELLARGVANALWPAKPAIAQSSRLPDKTSAMTPALPPPRSASAIPLPK